MRAIVFALAAVALSGCGVELEHGLDERQANEVAAVLEAAGVDADKQAEEGNAASYEIVVPRAEAGRAFAILEARDLPRRDQRGLSETFKSEGLLPSATEERARYAAALAAELERSLQGVPGVISARVHLALPPDEPLVGQEAHARPTASVLLKSASALPLADGDVRKLVAGAVNGLSPADVSVVVAAGVSAPPLPPFEHVGPMRVAKESRPLVAALATSGLALILLLSIAVVISSLRAGRLRRRVRELERQPSLNRNG
jgi:type III secretion protein J